jgi:hypothetical protein
LNELHENPFMRRMGEHGSAIVGHIFPDGAPEPVRALTAVEDYSAGCLVSASHVVDICDQLEIALAYMSGYRQRQRRQGEVITRYEHVGYELENLFLRMTSVVDRSLKLTNVVFQLGIPPRECRFQTVADNTHVSSTQIRSRLREIDKSVKPYRTVRNGIAHHEAYSDPRLKHLEPYSILERTGALEGLGPHAAHSFKVSMDAYVAVKREDLEPAVDALRICVGNFLTELLPIYDGRHSALSARHA